MNYFQRKYAAQKSFSATKAMQDLFKDSVIQPISGYNVANTDGVWGGPTQAAWVKIVNHIKTDQRAKADTVLQGAMANAEPGTNTPDNALKLVQALKAHLTKPAAPAVVPPAQMTTDQSKAATEAFTKKEGFAKKLIDSPCHTPNSAIIFLLEDWS